MQCERKMSFSLTERMFQTHYNNLAAPQTDKNECLHTSARINCSMIMIQTGARAAGSLDVIETNANKSSIVIWRANCALSQKQRPNKCTIWMTNGLCFVKCSAFIYTIHSQLLISFNSFHFTESIKIVSNCITWTWIKFDSDLLIECSLIIFYLFAREFMEFGINVARTKCVLDRLTIFHCIVHLLAAI